MWATSGIEAPVQMPSRSPKPGRRRFEFCRGHSQDCWGSVDEIERRAHDARRVDAVQTVHVLDVAALSEVADPEMRAGHLVDRGQERQGVRVAVEHGHHRRRAGWVEDGAQQRGGREADIHLLFFVPDISIEYLYLDPLVAGALP